MPDVEKVIKGLEKLRHNGGCVDALKEYCDGCPYTEKTVCAGAVIDDALALLKAREPRVMTELEACEWIRSDPELRDPIFEETRSGGGGVWIDPDNDYDTADIVGYGTTVRCWTSRPTDEQREAVKWDG